MAMTKKPKFKLTSDDYIKGLEHFQKSPVRLRYICSSIDPNWELRKKNDDFFDDEILDWFRPTLDERFNACEGYTYIKGIEITPWNLSWFPSNIDSGIIREFIFEFCIVIAKDYEGEN